MDLANSNNWSVIFEGNYTAPVIRTLNNGTQEYNPLEPVHFELASPIAIVTTTTTEENTKVGWYTACWASAYLKLASSDTKVFTKKCQLNDSVLLQLPFYGVLPYKLKLSFPWWLTAISIKVRQFTDQSGKYTPVHEQVLLSAIEVVEQRERELQQQVQQIQQKLG